MAKGKKGGGKVPPVGAAPPNYYGKQTGAVGDSGGKGKAPPFAKKGKKK